MLESLECEAKEYLVEKTRIEWRTNPIPKSAYYPIMGSLLVSMRY